MNLNDIRSCEQGVSVINTLIEEAIVLTLSEMEIRTRFQKEVNARICGTDPDYVNHMASYLSGYLTGQLAALRREHCRLIYRLVTTEGGHEFVRHYSAKRLDNLPPFTFMTMQQRAQAEIAYVWKVCISRPFTAWAGEVAL